MLVHCPVCGKTQEVSVDAVQAWCNRCGSEIPLKSEARLGLGAGPVRQMLLDRKLCKDVMEKLRETKQIYIVGHDIPISVSKAIFDMLNRKRIRFALEKGVPEVQYEFEDLMFELLKRSQG